ncbi:MAG: DUF4258 domain-containing protein [Candidatus Curtissbacteria bacterium]|nr:DUF4258 domain-containing protein [Candidatus Curtissbacteria bacterium]
MSIKFSDHATRQLKARKISKRDVIQTVKNPEVKSKSFKNRTLRRRRFGSKMLEVVTITEGSTIIVITPYYLEEEDEN